MACGGCGARSGTVSFPNGAPGASILNADSVLMEYSGGENRYRITGVVGPNGEPKISYPFASNHRQNLVYRWDVAHLMAASNGQIRLAPESPLIRSEPQLVAAGAPAVVVAAPPPPPAPVRDVPQPAAEAPMLVPDGPSALATAAADAAPVTHVSIPPPAAARAPAAPVPEGWLSEPEMQAMKRDELNAYATSKGIQDPEKLKNRAGVIRAVMTMHEMRGGA